MLRLKQGNGGLTPSLPLRMLEIMQLTIEIPDDQARRMGMDREGMQQLISRIVAQVPKLAAVDEIIEFLGRGPQPGQIVAFQVSEKSQGRVRDLLDKSRAGVLSAEEEVSQPLWKPTSKEVVHPALRSRGNNSPANP